MPTLQPSHTRVCACRADKVYQYLTAYNCLSTTCPADLRPQTRSQVRSALTAIPYVNRTEVEAFDLSFSVRPLPYLLPPLSPTERAEVVTAPREDRTGQCGADHTFLQPDTGRETERRRAVPVPTSISETAPTSAPPVPA